jgi:hypothetical protein
MSPINQTNAVVNAYTELTHGHDSLVIKAIREMIQEELIAVERSRAEK